MIVEKEGRLDAYLGSILPSRAYAVKLIESGLVTVNGLCVKKNTRLFIGDIVEYKMPEMQTDTAKPEDIELDIIYEDLDIIIINKPRGLVVHPAPGHTSGTLVNALLHKYKGRLSGIGGVERPGIVHRLDKDTSGLIAVAVNDNAHIFLSNQLQNHTMKRTYYALCHGLITKDSFTIDMPIGRHKTNRQKMAVVEHGRRAITHIKVIERYKNKTFLQADLQTGRTHQIRVHLSYINHPIIGDIIYGNSKQDYGGQVLHATRLELVHPATGDIMIFKAELPEYFRRVINEYNSR